jgi:metal-responsive CopG/Arc/MetJ family transcriptional regulator
MVQTLEKRKVVFSVSFPAGLENAVTHLAMKRGRSRSEIIAALVEQSLRERADRCAIPNPARRRRSAERLT